MACPIQEGKRETLEVGLFFLKMIVSSLLGVWTDVHGIVSWARWVTNCNITPSKKWMLHAQPLLYDFLLCFEIKKNGLPCKIEAFISNLCRIHYKQELYPWMRPEAAHCNLEASESESCCQATVYRWVGGGVGVASSGVLYCCPRPCLSFVIVASGLDLQLAQPWIIDVIFFFPSKRFYCAGPTWDIWHQLSPSVVLLFLNFLCGTKIKPILVVQVG